VRGNGASGDRPRVVLVSYHYYGSKRRAGFHFLADAYARLGWDVLFVTAPISWMSFPRRDPRLAYPVRRDAARERRHPDGVRSRVLFTLFHPANLRLGILNRLVRPLYTRYARIGLGALEADVRAADLVVFESTPALLLVERFRKLNPRARYVYRVSDDLDLLRVHPLVIDIERRVAPTVELVSASSAAIARRFAGLRNARVDEHGIDKQLFDASHPNPYSGGKNALFLGFWPLDDFFLREAAEQFPDVEFHVIGRLPKVRSANVVAHGELPFDETVPYVQHASMGLHTVAYQPGIEVLTDSLKVLQFSYCGLPIVTPAFVASDRPNVVTYRPDDQASVRAAVERALAVGRMPELKNGIRSWEELATALTD
jgi:2-beta-glucuronyltransferase